ncbi:major capsid hexamer protein [Microbacterium phage PauloDiaboli]|nr:major capsid hexamer protein [Microbacterium phage PauloDiaboli]QWY83938.1 major capsid hexamer protein [Microbacterium phage A3Wally]
MDHIKAQLDNLAELNDEQITALEASIIGQFDEFAEADRSAESVDAMSELADMLDSVRGEVVRREAQAEELEARAAEAANRVHGKAEDEEETAEAPESEDEPEVEEEAPVTASADEEEVVVAENAPEEITEAEASVEEVVAEEEVAEAAPEAEAAVEEVEVVEETAAEAAVEDAPAAEETTEVEAEASVEEVAEEAAPAEAEAAVEETVAEAEAPVEAEASNEETTIEETPQEEAQTVTAAADGALSAPADRAVDLQVTEAEPVAIVAGADIPGYSAGQPIVDKLGVAKAFTERLHTLRRANGGDGEQHTVASFQFPYAEERSLVAGAAEENGAKIAAAAEEHAALVASGGFGTPSPQRYDIFGFGTDARPVKDSLPKFQADRGSISYIEPPQLADYADAVGVWTPDMDEAAAGNGGSGADVVKNLLVVQGAQTRYAEIDAITLQLQIGNLLSRAYPELVARHNELALIQHARLAEKTILAKIAAGSTKVTAPQQLGVARDFLVTVRKAATQYRSRHRLPLSTPLQSIIPNWLFEAIASDLTLQMPGDDTLGVSDGTIRGYLSGSNVSFVASYDLNEYGVQEEGVLNSWDPDGTGNVEFDWFLFSEGTWLFLDGGTLDIGIVRDSTLVGTNDYRMFVETFEGVAKIGIESIRVRQTFKVSGAASALEDIN